MAPIGFEPNSSEPESDVLPIKLKGYVLTFRLGDLIADSLIRICFVSCAYLHDCFIINNNDVINWNIEY